MQKEIFKRFLPSFIGGSIGITIAAVIIHYGLHATVLHTLTVSLLTFVLYMSVRYVMIYKKVYKEFFENYAVRTPLPIVYIGDKGLYDKSYLDLRYISKVWGIKVNGIYYKASIEKDSYNNIHLPFKDVEIAINHENYGANSLYYASLPLADDLLNVCRLEKQFSATVAILNRFNIAATDWCYPYFWCLSQEKKPSVCFFSAREPYVRVADNDGHYCIRLVAK